jgi:hypothetical protein
LKGIRPELVRDPAEVERLLGIMSTKNDGRALRPHPEGADGHYDPDRLDLAIQHGFRIGRWSAADAAAQ